MNKMLSIAILLSFVLSGCGTFVARENGVSADTMIYPATRADVEAVYITVTGQSIFHYGDCDNANWFTKAIGYTIIPACFLIDIPISLVTDTVLLPFDIAAKPNEPN